MPVTSVTVRVPAKINLQLAVGPLRPDGYHGLVTVFHAISLFDEVTVAPAGPDSSGPDSAGPDSGGIDSVTVTGEGAAEVPVTGDNLALRAVRALRDEQRRRGAVPGAGVAVAISKRIPVAGGMAGGSADAAAALVACNELWDAGLFPDELRQVAAAVGSDVAFAVAGGTAVGRGRGEQLTPVLAAPVRYHWVIALADGQLSTPAVYGALDRMRGAAAVAEPELSAELMSALRAGDAVRLGAALANDLQAPAVSLFPALSQTLSAGRELGALGALVSGSGPSCYFLARDEDQAAELAAALSGAGAGRAVVRADGPVPGASVAG
ncbi:MAG TPA: 4-(cytidine 5'-diphospho)-2-C-methyl-D-erythritol kinase [Trebonia sp.]